MIRTDVGAKDDRKAGTLRLYLDRLMCVSFAVNMVDFAKQQHVGGGVKPSERGGRAAVRGALALGLIALGLAGCHSGAQRVVSSERARFYLESGGDQTETLTLPRSGTQISVMPKPVFTEYDFVNVEIAQSDQGKCLEFQFTPAAARRLYKLTAANPGRLLVLVLGDVAFGARRIVRPVDTGTLFVFVEVPETALPALVVSLKETCALLQPPAAK